MAGEQYVFDEPLGLYGYESHQRLAIGVIRDLIRYEETFEGTKDPLSELPYLGVSTSRPDEFRLGSLVDAPTARIGYGLALARPDADRSAMGGVFFRVDREEGPSVQEDKLLSIARPNTYSGRDDYEDQLESLLFSYDKRELEAIMRMIGKMTVSLELAHGLRAIDDEAAGELSIPSRMRHDAGHKRDKEALSRLSLVEPCVHFALRHHSKRQLNALFPTEQPLERQRSDSAPEDTAEPDEKIHIAEWQQFMSAAENLVKRESRSGVPFTHVNIEHEVDGKIYYVKLVAENEQLVGVQMLCDDTGASKSQLFNLARADDDDGGHNIVSPFWSKSEIVSCLSSGTIIDDESYEYYRLLAEKSLQAKFEDTAAGLLHIEAPPIPPKKPAE